MERFDCMKKIVLILLLLCSVTFSADKIGFGFNKNISLKYGERQISLTDLEVRNYKEKIEPKVVNLPLNKIIMLEDSVKLYIAMSFDLTVDKVIDKLSKQKDAIIKDAYSTDKESGFMVTKKDKEYFVLYFQSGDLKSPYFFTFSADSSEKLKKYYKKGFVSERVK